MNQEAIDNKAQIIDKIQKLLRLSNSPNETEANLAMQRVQEILAKYNLDMAMVKESAPESQTAKDAGKRAQTRMKRSAQYEWQRNLWKALAEANFCWHWIVEVFEGKRGASGGSKRPVKRHMILGSEANVIAVQMMGEYLEDTMERLLTSVGGFTNAERLGRSALSWKAGCAERLIERIEADANRRKQAGDAPASSDAPASTAIVLRNVYQSEFQANYEARHGEGSWARKLARDARPVRLSASWKREAEKARLAKLAAETPAEKARRERDEAKQQERDNKWWDNWARKQREKDARIDHRAFDQGRKTANDINLSTQVGQGSDRSKLS